MFVSQKRKRITKKAAFSSLRLHKKGTAVYVVKEDQDGNEREFVDDVCTWVKWKEISHAGCSMGLSRKSLLKYVNHINEHGDVNVLRWRIT